jgi:hypothetical protein
VDERRRRGADSTPCSANETFTVTESYSFSGFHAPTVTTPAVGCD